jgi:phospholipase/lecithinase/hemolysin
VNRLYAKGARAILIQVDFDPSKLLGYAADFGATRAELSAYYAQFNAGLIDLMKAYRETKPDLRILLVDIRQRLDEVLASPAQHGFTKTTIDVLHDSALTDQTFNGPGAGYVFWDPLHGTTKLHELIVAWNLEALNNSILEKLEATIVGGSPNIQVKHLQIGRDYSLEKSVDLTNWQEVTRFTANAGTNVLSDSAVSAPVAFFRLKWQR